MRRLLLLLVVSAAAALSVPTVLAGTPNGAGLFGEHQSNCTGDAFNYTGLVTLVPGNGNSFWVDGHHLVIQRAAVTDTVANTTVVYTFGAKTGKATPAGMVTCRGSFPGYSVVSYDVIVP